MSAFKGSVYWKEQCGFCYNRMFCKYEDAVKLLRARLLVVELESEGCYGTLSFWCDYYREDTEAVKEAHYPEWDGYACARLRDTVMRPKGDAE